MLLLYTVKHGKLFLLKTLIPTVKVIAVLLVVILFGILVTSLAG
jgi:hypothetical protein